jgi:hypothetical protein
MSMSPRATAYSEIHSETAEQAKARDKLLRSVPCRQRGYLEAKAKAAGMLGHAGQNDGVTAFENWLQTEIVRTMDSLERMEGAIQFAFDYRLDMAPQLRLATLASAQSLALKLSAMKSTRKPID